MEAATRISPGVTLLGLRSGTELVTNVIPSSLVLDLAVADSLAGERVVAELPKKWKAILKAHPDETEDQVRFEISSPEVNAGSVGLSGNPLAALLKGLLSL